MKLQILVTVFSLWNTKYSGQTFHNNNNECEEQTECEELCLICVQLVFIAVQNNWLISKAVNLINAYIVVRSLHRALIWFHDTYCIF